MLRSPFSRKSDRGRENWKEVAEFLWPERVGVGDDGLPVEKLYNPLEIRLVDAVTRQIFEAFTSNLEARKQALLSSPERKPVQRDLQELLDAGKKFAAALQRLEDGAFERLRKTLVNERESPRKRGLGWFSDFIQRHELGRTHRGLQRLLQNFVGGEWDEMNSVLADEFAKRSIQSLAEMVQRLVILTGVTLDNFGRSKSKLNKTHFDKQLIFEISSICEKALLLRFTRWPGSLLDIVELGIFHAGALDWADLRGNNQDASVDLNHKERQRCYESLKKEWKSKKGREFKRMVRLAFESVDELILGVESAGALLPPGKPLVTESNIGRYVGEYGVADFPSPEEFSMGQSWEEFVGPEEPSDFPWSVYKSVRDQWSPYDRGPAFWQYEPSGDEDD